MPSSADHSITMIENKKFLIPRKIRWKEMVYDSIFSKSFSSAGLPREVLP